MKAKHIILILLVAVACGVAYTSLAWSNKFANFNEAIANPDKIYKIAGNLDLQGAIEYDPAANANVFSFYLEDRKGNIQKVLLNRAKPYDFERAEEIVVTGQMVGGEFHATDILLKCPSKYNDATNIEITQDAGN